MFIQLMKTGFIKTLRIAATALILMLLGTVSAYACNYGNSDETSGGCGTYSGGSQPDSTPPTPPCTDADCAESCEPPSSTGGPGPSPSVAKPVHIYSGRELLSKADLIIAGAFPIRIIRNYDSGSVYDSPLGFGWALNVDKRIYKYADNSIIVRESCGRRIRYLDVGGSYQAEEKTLKVSLTENSDGSFVRTFPNGKKEFYDIQGKMIADQDIHGNRLEYTYDTRGRLPITGSSPYAVNPAVPSITSYDYRLTKIAERLASGSLSGQQVVLTYDDATGRLQKINSNDGREVVYTHDQTTSAKNGNLLTVLDTSNILHSYQYNDAADSHNLTSIQEANKTPYVNEYYAGVDKVKKQTHGGDTFEFTYNSGLKVTVVHKVYRSGTTTLLTTSTQNYTFDATGFATIIETVVDAGRSFKSEYIRNSSTGLNDQEIFSEKISPATTYSVVSSVNYTHDNRGHKTSEITTLASGEVITKTWGYQLDSKVFEQSVSSAAPSKIFRTEYTYYTDANGNPAQRKEIKKRRDDGSFEVTLFTYDNNGQVKTITSPTGLVTSFTYTNNKLTQKKFLVNGTAINQGKVSLDYDSNGFVKSVTDANNQTTNFVNDTSGRPLQFINALNYTKHFRYANNLLTEVEVGSSSVDGEGQVTQHIYTTEGWLSGVKKKKDDDTWLTVYSATFNSNGQPLTTTDYRNAVANVTNYQYNAIGQLVKITDPNNNVKQFTYDQFGNVITETDAKSRQVIYSYDALNRLVKIENTAVTPSAVTQMSYDAVGNLLSVTDAEGKTTQYTYNALSQLTTIIQPMGQTTTFVYDTSSRLDYKLDARGMKTRYQYYAWGPVHRIEYYASETAENFLKREELQYDNNGNLLSITDSQLGTGPLYSFTYDALNRVNTETAHYIPDVSVVKDNDYDRFGNRNRFTLQDATSSISNFTYNKLNQLSSVNLPGNQNVGLNYLIDANQIQKMTYPNSVTQDDTFDKNGLLLSRSIKGSAGVLDLLTFVYDKNLLVDSMNSTRDGGLHDYIYDDLDQLTDAIRPAPFGLANEAYQYDRVGNRDLRSDTNLYQYDNNHRITQSPGLLHYTYDDAGNLTQRSDGATFTFDHQNHLTGYAKGSVNATYVYDPLGRRIKKTVNGITTYFVWAGSKIIAEYSESGVREKRYAYLPKSLNPVQMEDLNGIYNIHADHLDTVRFITDAAQKVVWTSKQVSFGKMQVNDDPDANGVSVLFNHRFPGQYFDAETGLHQNYFRDYDPSVGRYIQSDPIGLAGGINTYAYALQNPLNYIDLYGLESDSPVAKPYEAFIGLGMILAALSGDPEMRALFGELGDAISDWWNADAERRGKGEDLPPPPPPSIPNDDPWPDAEDWRGQCIRLYALCDQFSWSGNCGACLLKCTAQQEWPFDGPGGCKPCGK
jgi:RHS repeat-associated protein